MIVGRAPGKAVLWGEYAVLAGAPAAVLAVDRQAVCELTPSADYCFIASGFDAPEAEFRHLPRNPPEAAPAALLAWQVLNTFDGRGLRPGTFRMGTDAFYAKGRKLGLGSSAALCVAVEGACARWLGEAPRYQRALAAHRRFQGGRGSGIDVAAAFFGGALRFQDGEAQPLVAALPQCRFVWTGEGADTGRYIDRFAAYLNGGDTLALDRLAEQSERLCRAPSLDALNGYAQALRQLDRAAGLGIYTAAHRRADSLAKVYKLAYKPCGAGGGDIGAVFAESPGQFAEFEAAAGAAGLTVLDLEAAPHGIEIRT
ncbi:MAG: hypothetical protein OXJ53_11580 [Gammaproteobacteria bacterium]|nr:hypothetical protein [Gammaproteobacteria bacterium]MDE0270303.1 hypothetical protein [Gammaproteobacteria bacterium]